MYVSIDVTWNIEPMLGTKYEMSTDSVKVGK